MIEILLNNRRRGRGFWKLNCNSLLEDINHVEKIRATIKSVVEENSDADPQLLWDTVKCRIRGTSRDYGTFKKRQEDNSLLELELQLDKYAKMYENKSDPEICQKLKMLNQTLTILCKEKIMVQQLGVEQEILSMVKKIQNIFVNMEKRNSNHITPQILICFKNKVISMNICTLVIAIFLMIMEQKKNFLNQTSQNCQ